MGMLSLYVNWGLFCQLLKGHPYFDVLEGVFMFCFLQMAEREVSILEIPCTFSQRKLSVHAWTSYFFASYCKFIAPAT